MIEVKQIPGTNIVEMVFEGQATAEEFESALKVFRTAIQEHGSIRLLEIFGDLDTPPIPWSKFWYDLKFGIEHLSDITDIAIVADQRWIAAWAKVLNPLFKADLCVFPTSQIEQARQWLDNAEAR